MIFVAFHRYIMWYEFSHCIHHLFAEHLHEASVNGFLARRQTQNRIRLVTCHLPLHTPACRRRGKTEQLSQCSDRSCFCHQASSHRAPRSVHVRRPKFIGSLTCTKPTVAYLRSNFVKLEEVAARNTFDSGDVHIAMCHALCGINL